MTQPHLKFHNPRTFEDLNKPVPNFRALTLKAGEVPKFFDTVLTRRADEAVDEVGVRQGSVGCMRSAPRRVAG